MKHNMFLLLLSAILIFAMAGCQKAKPAASNSDAASTEAAPTSDKVVSSAQEAESFIEKADPAVNSGSQGKSSSNATNSGSEGKSSSNATNSGSEGKSSSESGSSAVTGSTSSADTPAESSDDDPFEDWPDFGGYELPPIPVY